MQRALFLVAIAILSLPALVSAQLAVSSAQPFKLATIEVDGEARIGIVLGDELIVELNRANAALERNPAYPKIPMPANMRELIGQYEYGLKTRLYEIVNDIVANNRLAGRNRPSYAHEVGDVRLLAPLMPGKMLNAAVNFYSHVNEAGSAEEQRLASEERRRTRGIPYLFIKPTEGAVIGPGDDVVIPYGRDRIDWKSSSRLSSAGRRNTSPPRTRKITFSAIWSASIFPIAAGVRRIHDRAPTGSSAKVMTRLRRWARGLCRRSFTAIRWRFSIRCSKSTARSCSARAPAI
jgi:hypothetical protein